MKIKTLAIATALTVLPTLSFAMCSQHKEQQAMSCAAGTTYDQATMTCLPVST